MNLTPHPLSVGGEGLPEGDLSRQWRAKADRWTVAKPLARTHRRVPTPAESALWQGIRGGQLSGFRFRRQRAVDRFIVDFYCREASVVIEVDGPIHATSVIDDAQRQQVLEGQDLRVLRFSNEDVLDRFDEVIQLIRASLPSSSSDVRSALPLSANGEGDGG